jgi:hypothetical protein
MYIHIHIIHMHMHIHIHIDIDIDIHIHTYSYQRIVDKSCKLTFVCLTNKLWQAFEEGGTCTLNKVLGISDKFESFDHSDYYI